MAPTDLPAPHPEDADWESVEAELDQLINEFQEVQTEATYAEAEEALRTWIGSLNLSPRERIGLEKPLESLTGLLAKLEQGVVQIAAFGLVGRGKSSLLNALLGQPWFKTGPTHGVTRQVESVHWQVESATPAARVSLSGLGQSHVELIDAPGLDEVDGETREVLAQNIARQADLILFVIAGDITRVEHEALMALRAVSKPILLVFNKMDQYPEADRREIYETLRNERLKGLISPNEIVMAAADPLVAESTPDASGRLRPSLVRGQPQIDALKLKILEVLNREGKALIALNSLLYADEVNEKVLARKQQICDRIAEDTVWNAAMVKATAVALNPITVADILSGAVIDVALIMALSRLYGLPMTQRGAIRLLQQMALGMGGISASELLITFGLSSLKGVLGFSAPATGGLSLAPYIPVAITQAAVAGVSTYSLGQVTRAYLANGASWGPDGPKAMVSQIIDSLDETSILNRIKDELRSKLTRGERDTEREGQGDAGTGGRRDV